MNSYYRIVFKFYALIAIRSAAIGALAKWLHPAHSLGIGIAVNAAWIANDMLFKQDIPP